MQDDETLQLSAFEVRAESDKSYGALNSTSITGFAVALEHLPISADIFNEAFMKDTGSRSVEEMLQTYSAGVGFDTGGGAASAPSTQLGDRSGGVLTLRGLTISTMTRNGAFPLIGQRTTGTGITSNFDLERVEIINGPQSLLYGNGGGGGVINVVTKQARFGNPLFGSLKFQVDQYGHRGAAVDVGLGRRRFAVRMSAVKEEVGTRRTNINGPLNGLYGQIAAKLFEHTVVRFSGGHSTYKNTAPTNLALTAASTATDARNTQPLAYLLASGQIGASAAGPSGAGPVANGTIDWDNVNSFSGRMQYEVTVTTWGTLAIETRWNRWLSTKLSGGYQDVMNDFAVLQGATLYAPNAPVNPLKVWAVGTASTIPIADFLTPNRTKAIRLEALATNSLFGGRARSQTSFGADFSRNDSFQINYGYFQADSGLNVTVNPAVAANNGRTNMPNLYWPVVGGPVSQPFDFKPPARYIVINGVNYVRQIINPINSALISANNPLGVSTLGGNSYIVKKNLTKGIYAVNHTQWWDGWMDTLAGVRFGNTYTVQLSQGVAPPAPSQATLLKEKDMLSFNLGVDFRLNNWLRPYVAISDSYSPPSVLSNDPYGKQPDIANALGQEIGVKFFNETRSISGSLSGYYVRSTNEVYSIPAQLLNVINPVGLNGRFQLPATWINIDRESRGVQLALTASPGDKWRMRMSASWVDGTVGNTTRYAPLYNDQFHANSLGQVTYADGTLVYVNPTFNATRPVVTADTPGAVPLTVAMMSDRSSTYFANPVSTSGQITASSGAGRVLITSDPVHGPILTGRTGLPISAMQINPGFTPPESIVTALAGDATTAYPEYSVNLTNFYTINRGILRGVSLGESAVLGWKQRNFYYYPNGIGNGVTSPRALFKYPIRPQFGLIVSYERKVGKVGVSSQLNINNVFNKYHVIVLPNATNGWNAGAALNAVFDQQPRSFLWTNTITF
jgi:outer membrane receptor protein involved in Fe transport